MSAWTPILVGAASWTVGGAPAPGLNRGHFIRRSVRIDDAVGRVLFGIPIQDPAAFLISTENPIQLLSSTLN